MRTGERVAMIWSSIKEVQHTQQSLLRYLLFTIALSISIAHQFFSWGAAKWEFLLHTWRLSTVGSPNHFFCIKSVSLSVVHILVAVKVNDKRQGLEGETIFFIWRKSIEVVRHLNPRLQMYHDSVQWEIEFLFPRLWFEDFFFHLPLRSKPCRSIVEQFENNWGGLCVGGQSNLCLFGFSQGMLVTYNFNGSNNQLVPNWDQFPSVPEAVTCSLREPPRQGRLPNTVISAWEPFIELSSMINAFSEPRYCSWAWFDLSSEFLNHFLFMLKKLTTCSKRWWLLIFSITTDIHVWGMKNGLWDHFLLFSVGGWETSVLNVAREKNLSMQFHVWICGHQQDGMWSLGDDCIIFQSEAKRAMSIGGFWVMAL